MKPEIPSPLSIPDAPSLSKAEEASHRSAIDRSLRYAGVGWIGSALFWLGIGWGFHLMGALGGGSRWFTAALMAWRGGWIVSGGVGIALWILTRLRGKTLHWSGLWIGAVLAWNVSVAMEVAAGFGKEGDPLSGWGAALGWIVWGILGLGGSQFFFPWKSRSRSIAVLYLLGAWVGGPWFWRGYGNGVDIGIGLEALLIGLGVLHYFIPKILGVPLFSASLARFGLGMLLFSKSIALWGGRGESSASFSSWRVSVGVGGTILQLIPLLLIGVNFFYTVSPHRKSLYSSPALRFLSLGAIIYGLGVGEEVGLAWRSFHGLAQIEFLRQGEEMAEFLALSMLFFGAIYFIGPRWLGREWGSLPKVSFHFWGVAIGLVWIWGNGTIGGILEGLAHHDRLIPAAAVASLGAPFWVGRIGGDLLESMAYLVFCFLLFSVLTGRTSQYSGATLFPDQAKEEIE